MVNIETELEGSLEKLLEKRVETLEERFETLLDNDFQLGLLDQTINLDQESLKTEKTYLNKISTWSWSVPEGT